MSINSDLLVEIEYDFGTGPDCHNLKISRDESEDFWNWFEENAEECTSDNSLTDINSGSEYLAGNCFGNAQSISLRNSKYYYEGFVLHKNTFILHGFNYETNNVEDYTVHYNNNAFLDLNGNLPTRYVGVKIPSEFIRNSNSDIEENYLNIDPILLEYYRSTLSPF